MIERQELWCHSCKKYVQFELDLEINGNYVIDCPDCAHEHCRVVNNGVVTDIRWDRRNGPAPNGLNTIRVYAISATIVSIDDFATTASDAATTMRTLVTAFTSTAEYE